MWHYGPVQMPLVTSITFWPCSNAFGCFRGIIALFRWFWLLPWHYGPVQMVLVTYVALWLCSNGFGYFHNIMALFKCFLIASGLCSWDSACEKCLIICIVCVCCSFCKISKVKVKLETRVMSDPKAHFTIARCGRGHDSFTWIAPHMLYNAGC